MTLSYIWIYSNSLHLSIQPFPCYSSQSMRNLDWSLSSLSCSVAAWTFLAHSHGNYSTLCLCSLHFLTASPFKWLCAKLKQAFFSSSVCLSAPTASTFSPVFFFLISVTLFSLAYFTFFPSFFLWSPPLFTPSHTVCYTHIHAHTHTSIQTTSCLLCTDKSPLLVRTHSLDYFCTNICSSLRVLGHT